MDHRGGVTRQVKNLRPFGAQLEPMHFMNFSQGRLSCFFSSVWHVSNNFICVSGCGLFSGDPCDPYFVFILSSLNEIKRSSTAFLREKRT
jgi:hypothetical protein